MARGDLILVDHILFKHWAVDVGNGRAIENARRNGGCVDYTPISDLIGKRRGEWIRVSQSQTRRDEIARWAESQVEACEYDLFRYNCEHFAREAATGIRRSSQVNVGITLCVAGLLIWLAGRERVMSWL